MRTWFLAFALAIAGVTGAAAQDYRWSSIITGIVTSVPFHLGRVNQAPVPVPAPARPSARVVS